MKRLAKAGARFEPRFDPAGSRLFDLAWEIQTQVDSKRRERQREQERASQRQLGSLGFLRPDLQYQYDQRYRVSPEVARVGSASDSGEEGEICENGEKEAKGVKGGRREGLRFQIASLNSQARCSSISGQIGQSALKQAQERPRNASRAASRALKNYLCRSVSVRDQYRKRANFFE